MLAGAAFTPALEARTFADWQAAQNFTTEELADPGISGPTATPRNDGFSNLAKYALGLNVDQIPQEAIPEITSVFPRLTTQFQAPSDLEDVEYTVQFTSDLADPNSWAEGTLTMTNLGDNLQRIVALDPLTQAPASRFIRLEIERQGVTVVVPRNLNVTATSPTEATISFEESEGATGYLVEMTDPDGEFQVVGYVNAGASSFDVTGLIPEQTRTFRVRAIGGDESVTAASNTDSVTTEFGDQGAVILNYVNDQPFNGGGFLRFGFQIVNTSPETIPLNELTIRYWMTNETRGVDVAAQYFHAGVQPTLEGNAVTSIIQLETVNVEPATPGVDTYVDISFPTATQQITASGGNFAVAGQMFPAGNSGPLDPSNDYSFKSDGTLGIHPLVGLYRNGALIFGLPPGGGSPNGPNTPIALRARPMSESAIELTWEDEGNNESLYVIERKLNETINGIREDFSILSTSQANSITFEDTQLLDEAEYSYRVRAVNPSGASSLTNVATTATLPSTSITPTAPKTVSVKQFPNGEQFSDGRLDINWSDSSRNERGFIIERSEEDGPFEEIAQVTKGITSFIDFGLNATTNYSYRIKAFNLAGEQASSPSSGTTGDTPTEPKAPIARFLRQAAFGATPALMEDPENPGETITLIDQVSRMGYEAWLDAQFALSPSLHQEATAEAIAGIDLSTPQGQTQAQVARQNVWWERVLTAPDQARQRLAFALSQIFVVSQNDGDLTPQPVALAKFYDLLVQAPELSFRDLLEDVTLSPVMGQYLDHTRNQKANPATGVRPDENYAREIMQLFSIGLIQLNLDGTPKVDGNGNPLPTYNQRDIEQMARVFTGLTYAGSNEATYFTGAANFFDPMVMVPAFHETGAKDFQLLNSSIPDIAAGGDPLDDLRKVHDGLADHDSTAPFICRQLIQRTVTSNPSPAYVERVSQVFKNTGGDLKAVFKAVLLDYEARSADPLDSLTYGKQREPIIRLATLMRALKATPGTNGVTIGDLTAKIQQAPLRAASVFNFFEPGFSLPGAINDQGLDSPEFQTSQSSTVLQTINVVRDILFENNFGGLNLDFSRYSDALLSVDQLIDRLRDDLMDGRIPEDMRMIMKDHLSEFSDREERAKKALYLIGSSAEFNIEQ